MTRDELIELGKRAGKSAHALNPNSQNNFVSPFWNELTEGFSEDEIEVLAEGWDLGWDEVGESGWIYGVVSND